MKSEIKIQNQKKEIKFPCLAELLDDSFRGSVVLFIGPIIGTVVLVRGGTEDGTFHLGTISYCWFPLEDETKWRILSPECTIELSNQ